VDQESTRSCRAIVAGLRVEAMLWFAYLAQWRLRLAQTLFCRRVVLTDTQ
jgi:hypothetical protein